MCGILLEFSNKQLQFAKNKNILEAQHITGLQKPI